MHRRILLPQLLALTNAMISTQAFVPPNPSEIRSRPCTSFRPLLCNRRQVVRRAVDKTSNAESQQQERLFSQLADQIFAQISDDGSTIVFEDLTKWEELQELLENGDVFMEELQTFYDSINKINGSLDEMGFEALYNMIDDIFETESSAPPIVNREEQLISFLTNGITTRMDDLPCGIDCMDAERDATADLVRQLVAADSNNIATMQAKDMLGTWELLYTSSRAVIRNRNLSGLSVADREIRLSALRQTFTGSKFLGFVEFAEIYTRDIGGSFTVNITGEWMINDSARTADTFALKIDPENIDYDAQNASGMSKEPPVVQTGGGVSQVADWQSLGPVKLLDIIYHSRDLYIAQGQFDAKVLFVWRRVEP